MIDSSHLLSYIIVSGASVTNALYSSPISIGMKKILTEFFENSIISSDTCTPITSPASNFSHILLELELYY